MPEGQRSTRPSDENLLHDLQGRPLSGRRQTDPRGGHAASPGRSQRAGRIAQNHVKGSLGALGAAWTERGTW